MRSVVLVAALAVAGCAASVPPGTTGPEARPSAVAVAALADSLAAATTTTARVGVARRSLARSGVTPLSDFGRSPAPSPRFQNPLDGALVGGFVPGEGADARSQLVVMGAALDGPGAAALLEAARVLAERSRWAYVPERTVEVVLWSDAADERRAVRAAFAAALWPADQIRGAVVVADEGVGEIDGVPIETIPPGDDPVALAALLLERAVALARRPPAILPSPTAGASR